MKIFESVEEIYRSYSFNIFVSRRHQFIYLNMVYHKAVLGPLLVNVYLNDLFVLESQGNIHAFADDTVLLYQW